MPPFGIRLAAPLAETGDGTTFAPCEPIPGWKDNVIALSLDALAPDGRTRYSGASWISGNLPINRDLPRTTLARMTTLAGMPQTDTASIGPVASPETSLTDISLPFLLGVFLAVVAVVSLRRPRHRWRGVPVSLHH